MNNIVLTQGGSADLPEVMAIMTAAFDPHYGEAWTPSQCLSLLAMPGTALLIARVTSDAAGFALSRTIAGECELMMLGVGPEHRGKRIGSALLENVMQHAAAQGAKAVFLEVRADNPAVQLYLCRGFEKVGFRANYYRGCLGDAFDAETYRLCLT